MTFTSNILRALACTAALAVSSQSVLAQQDFFGRQLLRLLQHRLRRQPSAFRA